MSIHREGNMFISVTLLLVAASGFGMVAYGNVIFSILNIVLAIVLLFFLQFFRNPKRHIPELESDEILCPADGRIVAIEETSDHEITSISKGSNLIGGRI